MSRYDQPISLHLWSPIASLPIYGMIKFALLTIFMGELPRTSPYNFYFLKKSRSFQNKRFDLPVRVLLKQRSSSVAKGQSRTQVNRKNKKEKGGKPGEVLLLKTNQETQAIQNYNQPWERITTRHLEFLVARLQKI